MRITAVSEMVLEVQLLMKMCENYSCWGIVVRNPAFGARFVRNTAVDSWFVRIKTLRQISENNSC